MIESCRNSVASGERYLAMHPDAVDAVFEKLQAKKVLLEVVLTHPPEQWEAVVQDLHAQEKNLPKQKTYASFLQRLQRPTVQEKEARKRAKEDAAPLRGRRYISLERNRARKQNCEATLTYEEWQETLTDFKSCCAYCQKSRWTCMEHFIPISQGGGTTRYNCVPACDECDRKKGGRMPEFAHSKKRDIERVRAYLLTRV